MHKSITFQKTYLFRGGKAGEKQSIIAIWHITESLLEFASLYPQLKKVLNELSKQFKSEAHILEKLAVRALIETLFPNQNIVLTHTSSGKPQLSNNVNISISHTKNFAAIIISEHNNVAIDIEYNIKKTKKLGKRFLLKNETPQTEEEYAIHWCAKETLFKYFDNKQLFLTNFFITPFKAKERGKIIGNTTFSDQIISIFYENTPHFVLTYII